MAAGRLIMEMAIQLALPEDIPAISVLISLSVRELSKGYYTPKQIASGLKYVFGVDTQLIKDNTYYTVLMDKELAACGGWSKRNTLYGGDQHKEKEDPLLDPSLDAAKIRAFFVHPGYARKGIGRMLINFCEGEAEKAGFKRFELGSTLPGVPLYQAMGYETLDNLDALLPDGELLPIVKMTKSRVSK